MTTSKIIQSDILKNVINKSIQNPRKIQITKRRIKKEKQETEKTNNKMADLSSNISIITLNVN